MEGSRMTLELILVFVVFVALNLYVLGGGADFGVGIVHGVALVAGKRDLASSSRRAIGPIWEANHVWMIFVIVMLFVGFPKAYSLLMTRLHVPFFLLLFAIVVRGSTYVFSSYGLGAAPERRFWNILFSASSLCAAFLPGAIVGAVVTGLGSDSSPLVPYDYLTGWLGPTTVAVGFMSVALMTMLASSYLLAEAKDADSNVFLRSMLVESQLILSIFSLASLFTLSVEVSGRHFFESLTGHFLSGFAMTLITLMAIGVIFSALKGETALARIFAAFEGSLILWLWAIASYPDMIPGLLSVEVAAAPAAVLKPVLFVVVCGLIVVGPALIWLYRIFKFADDNDLSEAGRK